MASLAVAGASLPVFMNDRHTVLARFGEEQLVFADESRARSDVLSEVRRGTPAHWRGDAWAARIRTGHPAAPGSGATEVCLPVARGDRRSLARPDRQGDAGHETHPSASLNGSAQASIGHHFFPEPSERLLSSIPWKMAPGLGGKGTSPVSEAAPGPNTLRTLSRSARRMGYRRL